jgi:lipoprotein signal peptidase
MMLINFLISILFLADRLTKWLALRAADLTQIFDRFYTETQIFGLRLYKNPNMIFNWQINGALLYGLIFFSLAVLLWLLIKNYQKKNIFLIFSLSLIIAGAISNLIDRLMFGYVIDFLSFFDYSIFNLSDVYIVVGIGLILIHEFWQGAKSRMKTNITNS